MNRGVTLGRGFASSATELREAELFWSRLTGGAPRRSGPSWLTRLPTEAEAYAPSAFVEDDPPRLPAPASAPRDWTNTPEAERLRYVVDRLITRYGYPVNGAAGLVGNLYAESGLLPNRVEGSHASTPTRAPSFSGGRADFTLEQIMNRSRSRRQGPRLPGVGLAQWTSRERRAGLFQHVYQGQTPGASILLDMDAQLDYLVSELGTKYASVDRTLRDPSVSLDAASDDVVYRFEVPGSVLTTTEPRQRLPRTDASVVAVFTRRRQYGANALAAYRNTSRTEDWSIGEDDTDSVEAFKRAVLEQQSRNAIASGRTRYEALPDSELAIVEGRHRLRTEAAEQCRALLSAARAELAAAQRAGTDGDAARVTHIGITSSYRDVALDGRLWHQYFPRYYQETQRQREELVGGPHGDAAVRFLARYISQRKAAPGFSNHSDGRAVDFTTTEGGIVLSANVSQRAGWRRTWLHRWLVPNAERYGFHPLATEEWHWDYRTGTRR